MKAGGLIRLTSLGASRFLARHRRRGNMQPRGLAQHPLRGRVRDGDRKAFFDMGHALTLFAHARGLRCSPQSRERPRESTAATQPQLQPALLRSSAMISEHGNRFVTPLLTASSVIAVMPACMLTVPNPSSRSERPAHCDGGIHYVWPCKLEALVLVMVFAIAAHIPHKQNKATEQRH